MAAKRPNTVISVYDIKLVGIHFINEYGEDQVRMAGIEPNGVVHLFPETIQNTRFFARAAGWIKDGVASLLGTTDMDQDNSAAQEHVSGL